MFVNEKVVFASLKVEVSTISLIPEEYLFAVGHIAPDTYVASSSESESEQAKLLLQSVEHIA